MPAFGVDAGRAAIGRRPFGNVGDADPLISNAAVLPRATIPIALAAPGAAVAEGASVGGTTVSQMPRFSRSIKALPSSVIVAV